MKSVRLVTSMAVAAAVVASPAISRADQCSDDSACAGMADSYCAPSGACTPRSASGVACSEDDACSAKICAADGKCGATNGEPACTLSSAATVCRSGQCSASGVCVPQAGGCYLDSDCTNVQFCNRTTYACTAVLPDGAALPPDGLHDACLAGDPNDACESGACDPATKTCAAQGSVSAAVKPSEGAAANDAGTDAGDSDDAGAAAVNSILADAGIDGAAEIQAVENAVEQHFEKEIPGLSCNAAGAPSSGSNGGSGYGGLFDLVAVAGALALFRKVTSKGLSSSRTGRRRSPAA